MTTAKLLAPIAPFTAEAIYRDLTAGERRLSVHMADWPVADGARTDYDLERDMGAVRAVVEAAAYARQKANMKLRWPVARLVVATDEPDVRSALARFRATLLEQGNAKDVEIVGADWEDLDLAVVPNKAAIGKGLRERGPALLRALASLPSARVRELRGRLAHGGVAVETGQGEIPLAPDMVTGFETRLPPHTTGADFDGGSVYVDTEVGVELQAEGASRDLARRVQEMRKLLGLAMADLVATQVAAPEDFVALVRPHAASVAEATRSASLEFVDAPRGALVKEWDLEDVKLTIGLTPGRTHERTNTRTTPSRVAKPTKKAPPRAASKISPPAKPAKKAVPKKASKKATPPARPKRAAPKKAAPKKPAKRPAPNKAAKRPAPKKAAKKAPAKKAPRSKRR